MLNNSLVDIWGHPTLFAQKNNINLNSNDFELILMNCVENNVLIELNAKYNLPPEKFVRIALDYDVKFVIGSDAHDIESLLTVEQIKVIHNWVKGMY
jgi:histidinol phosphatase-like PHP family hydrolase